MGDLKGTDGQRFVSVYAAVCMMGAISALAFTAAQNLSATPPVTIAILNRSTLVQDVEVVRYAKAIQEQVSRHFAPYWEYDARITVITDDDGSSGAWRLQIEDGDETTATTGYHDLEDNGIPFLRVYVTPCQKRGVSVSSAMSSQILETLANPYLDRVVLIDNLDGTALATRIRVCDPVGTSTYLIDSVTVANFVTPAYFFRRPAGPYDYLRFLTAPLSISKDGSQMVRYITKLSEWLWRF
jgi:hypothetical protein